jgi:hypothetical protein
MGAVFVIAAATIDITTAPPDAVATGMRSTFAGAAMLMVVAIVTYRRTLRDRAAKKHSC